MQGLWPKRKTAFSLARTILSLAAVAGVFGNGGVGQESPAADSNSNSAVSARLWSQGWAYYESGETKKALQAYERAFNLDRTNAVLAHSATALAFELKDKQKIVEIWSAHTSARPSSTGGYTRNHQLQNAQHDVESANEFLQEIESRRRRLAKFLHGSDDLREILRQRIAFAMKKYDLIWSDIPSHKALNRYRSGIQLKGTDSEPKMHVWISEKGNGQTQFSSLVFELFNAEAYGEVVRLTDLARSGQIPRDEFISRAAGYEYKTHLRLRCFFAFTECDAITLDADWSIDVPGDFRLYMSRFEEGAEYPHGFFGRFYDQIHPSPAKKVKLPK